MKVIYKPVRGADLNHQLVSVDGGRTYHRYQDLTPANKWLTKEYLPKEWDFAPSPRGSPVLRNAPRHPESEEIMSERSNPPMGVAMAKGTTAEFQQLTDSRRFKRQSTDRYTAGKRMR